MLGAELRSQLTIFKILINLKKKVHNSIEEIPLLDYSFGGIKKERFF